MFANGACLAAGAWWGSTCCPEPVQTVQQRHVNHGLVHEWHTAVKWARCTQMTSTRARVRVGHPGPHGSRRSTKCLKQSEHAWQPCDADFEASAWGARDWRFARDALWRQNAQQPLSARKPKLKKSKKMRVPDHPKSHDSPFGFCVDFVEEKVVAGS